jgi:hypothetical protein
MSKEERMTAFLDTASKLCTGDCSCCLTKDERFYDPKLVRHLTDYGLPEDESYLVKNVCSLAATVGKEMEEYGCNTPSNYQRLIISTAKGLQRSAIGKAQPENIKSTIGFLRAYTNLTEEHFPLGIEIDAKKTSPVSIITPTTSSIIPRTPKVIRMSASVKSLFNKEESF